MKCFCQRFSRPQQKAIEPEIIVHSAALDQQQEIEFRWQLATYETIRSESEQAQNAMQHVMQWGLAVAVGSIGAGLALSSIDGNAAGATAARTLQLLIFGFIVPCLALAIGLVWLGEFARMARAGSYLRWVERKVSETSTSPIKIPGWELALSGDRPDLFKKSRNYAGYLGSGTIFAGAQLASAIIFASLQYEYKQVLYGVNHVMTTYVVFGEVAICWAILMAVAMTMVMKFTKDSSLSS